MSNSLPITLTTLVCESRLVITKKGKRDGTTQVAHSVSPFLVAVRLELENTTKQIVNRTKVNGKIFRLKERKINFM